MAKKFSVNPSYDFDDEFDCDFEDSKVSSYQKKIHKSVLRAEKSKKWGPRIKDY